MIRYDLFIHNYFILIKGITHLLYDTQTSHVALSLKAAAQMALSREVKKKKKKVKYECGGCVMGLSPLSVSQLTLHWGGGVAEKEEFFDWNRFLVVLK